MKKKILLLFLFFIFNTNAVYSNEKTAFIDIDFVLNNSYLGQSIYEELEKLNENNIKKLALKEEIIKEKKETINKTKNISSKEKLKKDINLFNKELEIYKVEKNNLLNKFKKKKQQDLENFLIDINPIIQEYMKSNSIDIVLDKKQIFIGNSKNDITQDILDLVNKTFKKK